MRVAALSLLAVAACRAPAPRSEPAPPRPPLQLTYLGAAGWQLDGDGHTVLVDPYYTRPASLDGPIRPDPAAIAARAPARADLILVGHTHIDHALDAPAVALRTGAELVGSASTALLARASGVPDDRIVPVRGGEDYTWDGLSVRVVPSLHSALDHKHTVGHALTEAPTLPMGFDDYAEGGTFIYLVRVAGRQVLFVGTANFIERELEGLRPDIAVIATGLRQEVHDYTCRLVRALGKPPVIYTNHFDDWRSPPGDQPVDDDVRGFQAEVERCAPGTRVIVPRPFEPYPG